MELVSPLSPDECARRLEEAIDPFPMFWPGNGTAPVIGRVRRRSVRIMMRRDYRNSFQTFLRGTLHEHGSGTIFRFRAGVHPFVIGFMIFYFIFVSGVGIAVVKDTIGVGGNPVCVAFFPVIMVIGGIGLIIFCRWLARDEKRFLIRFVAETINAEHDADAKPALPT